MERGSIVSQRVSAIVSQLPRQVGERELAVVRRKLSLPEDAVSVDEIDRPRGPGNVVMAVIQSEHITEVFAGFGERGLKAEGVASSVAERVREYLAAGVPVGRFLADQLMIPMALAGGGEYTTLPLSRHSQTNVEVLKKFLDVDVTVTRTERSACHVRIEA
jgi:RNA 3'-terminal phosphate cyclase (ATP)